MYSIGHVLILPHVSLHQKSTYAEYHFGTPGLLPIRTMSYEILILLAPETHEKTFTLVDHEFARVLLVRLQGC